MSGPDAADGGSRWEAALAAWQDRRPDRLLELVARERSIPPGVRSALAELLGGSIKRPRGRPLKVPRAVRARPEWFDAIDLDGDAGFQARAALYGALRAVAPRRRGQPTREARLFDGSGKVYRDRKKQQQIAAAFYAARGGDPDDPNYPPRMTVDEAIAFVVDNHPFSASAVRRVVYGRSRNR